MNALKTLEPIAALVPNGTDPSDLDRLVVQFQTFARKSAENILGMAETLLEAERTLPLQASEQFCLRVGLDRKGSTYRKLRAIGEASVRFKPLVDRLPNHWTTLYPLAKLPGDDFDRVTSDERFNPSMTAGDIRLILNGPPKPNTDRFSKDFFVDVSELLPHRQAELWKDLKELVKRYGVACKSRNGIRKNLKLRSSLINIMYTPEEAAERERKHQEAPRDAWPERKAEVSEPLRSLDLTEILGEDSAYSRNGLSNNEETEDAAQTVAPQE
jgi:hypothetical protein